MWSQRWFTVLNKQRGKGKAKLFKYHIITIKVSTQKTVSYNINSTRL